MSNNLNIDQMTPSQDQKETTHNDANGQIDAALTAIVAIAVDDSDTATLTAEQWTRNYRFALIDDTPAPDADVTINVPATNRGIFIVSSGLSFPATIQISGQSITPPIVDPGERILLECDGTTVRKVVNTPSKLDWTVPFNPGAPSSSEFMGRWVAPRAFEIPIGMVGSQGHAGTAATAQTDFDVQLNAVSIGTIRFAASGTVATFIKASASTIAAGDRIDIIAPGTADATLADLTFTIVGEDT